MGASNLTSKQLAKAMKLMGLTQEKLAGRLELSHPTVGRWLSGKTPVPGYLEAWLRDGHPEIYRRITNRRRGCDYEGT